jgi:general secretion pathway protein L
MEAVRKAKLKLEGVRLRFAAASELMKRVARQVLNTLFYSPFDTLLPASVLCVTLNPGRVGLIHAKRAFWRYRIVSRKSYEHTEGAYPSPDETAADAALFMKEAGLEKGDAVLVLPGSWMMLKQVELPAAVRQNLAGVVGFEFDRFTPLAAADALYDYFPDDTSGDTIRLFLAVAKAATVNEYTEKLASRALSVRRIDFEMSALSGYCRFVSGFRTACFAGVRPDRLDGGYWDGGCLKGLSACECPQGDDYEKAGRIEAFAALRKEQAPGETEPLLLAFDEDAAGIRSALASRANIKFRTTAEFSGKIKQGAPAGVQDAIAAGGALGYLCPTLGGFNLLSRGIHKEGKRSYLLFWILSGAVILSLALCFFLPMNTERERLEEIDRQIAQRKADVLAIEKVRGEIEAINKKGAMVDGFRGDKPNRIELVKELTSLIPQNSWLTRVRIIGEKVNIEGYAHSATGLIQTLEASKYFMNAEFASPTFRDHQMNMDRFQIKMLVREIKKGEQPGEKQ